MTTEPKSPTASGVLRGETGVDLTVEQPRIVRNALWALLFCALVLGGGYLILPRYFSFPEDLIGALTLTIRADMLVLLWVVWGIRRVARVRFTSPADIRGSAYSVPSHRIAVPAAFLQNTLEQAFIAVGAHLALATVLTGPPLSLIPAAVLLFGAGRLAFMIGYPRGASGRAFGIVTTMLPTVAGYLLTIILLVRSWLE